jgi:hypothetical protein
VSSDQVVPRSGEPLVTDVFTYSHYLPYLDGTMKQAVSVSLGSSARDKRVEIELGGVAVSLERLGTDGDAEAAAMRSSRLWTAR